MYYDSNNVQLSTKVDEVDNEDVAAKYRAWNWHVITVDGNDVEQLRAALVEANAQTEKPTIIIGHSVMAKGAVGADGRSFEGCVSTHGQPLSGAGADLAATIRHLGGDEEDPFKVFAESREIYETRRCELKMWAAQRRKTEAPRPVPFLFRIFIFHADHLSVLSDRFLHLPRSGKILHCHFL